MGPELVWIAGDWIIGPLPPNFGRVFGKASMLKSELSDFDGFGKHPRSQAYSGLSDKISSQILVEPLDQVAEGSK